MLLEIWNAYLACLREAWPWMLGAAIAGAAMLAAWEWLTRSAHAPADAGVLDERAQSIVQWTLFTIATAIGLSLVVARASVFDDAFISFRFVRNLLDGHGLVWNLGERVEGYTNFLWVMLVAAGSYCSGIQPAEVGLWASIAVFPCSLAVVFLLERTLGYAASSGRFFPIATMLLAVQDSFVTAGSTGLETGFAALLVSAGLLGLVRARSAEDWFRTGLLLILASLTRPDHAIFYATGSAVLAWEQGSLVARLGRPALRGALRYVLAFASPFLLYVAHTAWRFYFYGELLPNTYYAKASDGSYFSQGAAYAATFYLASHLWIVLPAVALWAAWPARELALKRFKLFLAISFVVYNAYVLKVGGDFMFGRFYVTMLPLILVALARIALDLLSGQRAWRGVVAAGLVAATAGGVHIIAPGAIVWGICDERTLYPVARWHPLVIHHSNFRVGQTLATWRKLGVPLRVATSGIGMVGYNSGLEVIDLMGLTDADVAREPIVRRGRPGHEKLASSKYIAKRQPDLVRHNYHRHAFEDLTRFQFGPEIAERPWYIYRYDRQRLEKIAAISQTVRFIRFEQYLKRYIKGELPKKLAQEIDRDVRFFRRYYFDHNDDPKLLEKLLAAVEKARAR